MGGSVSLRGAQVSLGVADDTSMKVDQNERRASGGLGDTLVRRRADDRRTADPVGTRFARFLGLHTDARASNRGANGELVSGWWLGRLPEGWHVINEVPVGDAGAKVDHVVIGPSGVFTINTKNLTGKVWVGPKSILYNRRSTDFLPRATAEAGRASRLLAAAVGRAVEVRGVLAILCDDWTIKQRPAEVYVDATRGVKDWMLRQPAVLRSHEVIELARAASNPDTWAGV
jgi:Nuclease-related domain